MWNCGEFTTERKWRLSLPEQSPTLSDTLHCSEEMSTFNACPIPYLHLLLVTACHLGKKKVEDGPTEPSHFHPIALSYIHPAAHKQGVQGVHQLAEVEMVILHAANKYMATTVQKTSTNGVPGFTEHHLKLLSYHH